MSKQTRIRRYAYKANDVTLIQNKIKKDEEDKKKSKKLPLSLMSDAEFERGRIIAAECQKHIQKNNAINAQKIPVCNPEHPAYPLYAYIQTIKTRLEGTRDENRCPICGTIIPETARKDWSKPAYPYCSYCGRQVIKGILRGVDTSRGIMTMPKTCSVCGRTPVRGRGLCSHCEYIAINLAHSFKPKDIRMYIIDEQKEKENRVESLKKATSFTDKEWDPIRCAQEITVTCRRKIRKKSNNLL